MSDSGLDLDVMNRRQNHTPTPAMMPKVTTIGVRSAGVKAWRSCGPGSQDRKRVNGATLELPTEESAWQETHQPALYCERPAASGAAHSARQSIFPVMPNLSSSTNVHRANRLYIRPRGAQSAMRRSAWRRGLMRTKMLVPELGCEKEQNRGKKEQYQNHGEVQPPPGAFIFNLVRIVVAHGLMTINQM